MGPKSEAGSPPSRVVRGVVFDMVRTAEILLLSVIHKAKDFFCKNTPVSWPPDFNLSTHVTYK